MVGNLGELTANDESELLISEISTEVVPVLVMERFFDTPFPTCTSPKSMDEGVATSAFEVVEEKAFESDPQPDTPILIRMPQAIAK